MTTKLVLNKIGFSESQIRCTGCQRLLTNGAQVVGKTHNVNMHGNDEMVMLLPVILVLITVIVST
jgi:hypothetical protein